MAAPIKPHTSPPVVKVAIIGGGPGGLAAAIELGKLPSIQWTLYEKKSLISETGGGISLQRHTWRMLELMGAANNICPDDYFRPPDGHTVQHRNSRTGELLSKGYAYGDAVPKINHASCRMVRPKLQDALLKEVDQAKIQTSRKLVNIERILSPESAGKLRIIFHDGFEDQVDLLVGADGIRSVVRAFVFPTHHLSYTGQSAYRTLVKTSRVDQRLRSLGMDPNPLKGPIFWHNINGRYAYTCPLGGNVFEVTARIRRPSEGQQHVSWGMPFDFSQLLHEFEDFSPAVLEILRLAAEEGETQEFAMFSGPRLESCVDHVATTKSSYPGAGVVLIGDASHPLSGAFGAGAGFAFEDAYTLGKALQWAFSKKSNGTPPQSDVAAALSLYDSVRSPHYSRLYEVLDRGVKLNGALLAEQLPIDDEISERVKRLWGGKDDWMYYYKADDIMDEAVLMADRNINGAAIV